MAAKKPLPTLSKLTELEARAVESMFRVYDYQAKGRIPQHLAFKLCQALGFQFSLHSLPVNASLKELLLFLDMRVPDPEPALYCQLNSFTSLVAKPVSELMPLEDQADEGLEGDEVGPEVNSLESSEQGAGGTNAERRGSIESQSVATGSSVTSGTKPYASGVKVVSTQAINQFMEKLGRPPVPKSQCDLLLTSMLDYDDCSESTYGQPAVLPEYFSRDFGNFAKKSNALKNFK
jgi:hypothetical protein